MKKILVLLLSVIILIFACKTTSSHIGGNDLFTLVETGNLEELKTHEAGELSVTNAEGLTLLHAAALYNRPAIAEYLIGQGLSIEALDNYARTPLLLGMYSDSFDACAVLIKHDAHIFAADFDKNTPFSYSVAKNSYTHLLTKQNVYQRDANDATPLHHAVRMQNRPLVAFILTLGKPSAEKDKSGKTPMELAYETISNKNSVEIAVDILLAGGKPAGGEYAQFETAALRRNFGMRFDDGNTPLHIAAQKGQKGIAEFLIAKNVMIDAKNIANATPLHEAVRNGNEEIALMLLNAKANPNACDANGNTALHLVMPEAKRSVLFGQLLKYGADVNAQDNYGETATHIAARIGMSADIIQTLVDAGADPNERNKKGQTPLMLAVERNQLEQAKVFIKLGANIHDQDNDGISSFMRALDLGADATKLMVNKKNIGVRDSFGRTPLHIAVLKNAPLDCISYLLGEGSEINTRDKDGNSPLHVAVEQNNKEVGQILISKNADIFLTNNAGESPLRLSYRLNAGREDWLISKKTINSKDATGNTPLHLAAEWNNPNMIGYLLDRGANINAKNDIGETPFFSSMKGNSPACIDALLNYPNSQINIAARDFLGNCVLHTAVQWSAYEAATKVVSLTNGASLVQARNLAGKTALHVAAAQGSLRFIQMLLGYGLDVNETDELGRSALVYAINGNKLEAVKYLLSQNASPIQQDMYGQTPLHFAVENKNIECVRILQAAGANAMAKDTYGQTPLSLAMKQSQAMISAVLGKNKTVQNSDGESPLHIAVIENAGAEQCAFLLNQGYQINKRNKDGSTALLLAVQFNRSDIIPVLLSHGADAFAANNVGISPLSLVLTEHTEYLQNFSTALHDTGDAMGDTILHYASRLSTVETVQALLTAGHQKEVRNLEGQTPLDMARRWEKTDIAKLLAGYVPASDVPADKKEETPAVSTEKEMEKLDKTKIESVSKPTESDDTTKAEMTSSPDDGASAENTPDSTEMPEETFRR